MKGERCGSPKCGFTRRNYPPGAHGLTRRRRRITPYGEQLRAKQKMKRFYGLLEKQFHRYFDESTREKGDTAIFLVQALESRLDNAVYRMGFATSRRQARQMVNHRHFLVNGKPVNIPSFSVKIGDVVAIKESKKKLRLYETLPDRLTKVEPPKWIAVDSKKYEGKIVDLPETEDLTKQFDLTKIIEFYSR